MRAAIHNPYLDTLGGGERYTMSFAKVLIDKGYEVDLEWKDPHIVESLEDRFGINLDKLKVVLDIKRGDGYDLCFWVSDGSIPALKARKNILHFQIPFSSVNGRSLLNKMKLFRVSEIICNSNFTKNTIDREYGVDSLVIYPPVDTTSIKPKRKENIILYVGRFSELKQSKGQDILIQAFKTLVKSEPEGWKLILAGGVEVGSSDFIKRLDKISENYNIEIIKSPDFKTLAEIYGKSRIFWSASGFGIEEDKSPEKVEHFGITVVEAMASATVPIVYSAGGHREIVSDGENGYLWKTVPELLRKTKKIIDDKSLLRRLSLNSIESSKKYAYEKFESGINKVL